MSVRDEVWFDALFRANSVAVYRFFVRRTARDDCEDLTADVFTTAWRRREDVPEGAELPWLYKTAGYLLANHRRKRGEVPSGPVVESVLDAQPVPVQLADEEVRTALGSLSERDVHILLLHAWEGLQGDALAHSLGLSRSASDSALSRARSRLREAWAAQDRV